MASFSGPRPPQSQYAPRPQQNQQRNGQQNAPRPPIAQIDPVTSKNYVDCAEAVMRDQRVTTSQLRNLLSLTADIYNRIETHTSDDLPDDVKASLVYLRVQFVYAAGRDQAVREFIDQSRLLEVLKEAPKSRESALLLCRYLEALAAYKKYYDPKDK